jgi:hypothetical protein
VLKQMASVDAMLAKLQKSSKGLLAEMTEAIPSNFKVFASFLIFFIRSINLWYHLIIFAFPQIRMQKAA